jgi:hypothetical protein
MVLLQSPDSCKAQQEASFCYTYFVPEGVESLSSREFGYLISTARTRITSAVTNRQSTATVIATRIQDDFLSNRPHLLCAGTARRSVSTACGPTAHSSEPIFHRRSHTRKRSSISLLPRRCRGRRLPSHKIRLPRFDIYAACGQLKRTVEG